MKLTAAFEPVAEGGFAVWIEEIPGVISQGETLDEARENIMDALHLVLECNREIAQRNGPEGVIREAVELAKL